MATRFVREPHAYTRFAPTQPAATAQVLRERLMPYMHQETKCLLVAEYASDAQHASNAEHAAQAARCLIECCSNCFAFGLGG